MHLIKDSKETVITFNLLERIGETHPCQSSLLYDSRCRGVTDCLCRIAIADIVLPIILRQATNGPDRCLDRLIVHAFTGTSDGATRDVKKLDSINDCCYPWSKYVFMQT